MRVAVRPERLRSQPDAPAQGRASLSAARPTVRFVNPVARATTDCGLDHAFPVYPPQAPCEGVAACSRNESWKALLPSPSATTGSQAGVLQRRCGRLRERVPKCAWNRTVRPRGIRIASAEKGHDQTAKSRHWITTTRSVIDGVEGSRTPSCSSQHSPRVDGPEFATRVVYLDSPVDHPLTTPWLIPGR